MKISNGTILEMVLAIFFLLVGFNIKDSFTSFIVILMSIIVIIHTLYIFFSKDKNNFPNCNDNNFEKKSNSNGFIKIFLIIVFILIILLVGVSSLRDNTNDKRKSEKEKEDDSEELITQNQEPCSYYPIDGNYNIIISAESSAGVGDVFSKMDSNLEYRIHDNNYGDTYVSGRKYQGDQTRYECDEIWYEVYLQNGKHGFVWAGSDGMYAKEQ